MLDSNIIMFSEKYCVQNVLRAQRKKNRKILFVALAYTHIHKLSLIIDLLQGKDTYGNEVTHLGRPLPVEYLLVDMPAAFPADFQYTFKTMEGLRTFPVENREHMGETRVSLYHYEYFVKLFWWEMFGDYFSSFT